MNDVVVIGAGLVGLATAYQLKQSKPDLRISVLEKEPDVCRHQSGNNSGVLHSGIYYKPGSFKADLCRTGKETLEGFCRTHSIPFELCGKVIVATSDDELPRLQTLFDRGTANLVPCTLFSPDQVREIEPHVRSIRGIHVPGTGIVSYPAVAQKLKTLLEAQGVSVILNAAVGSVKESEDSVIVGTSAGDFEARGVVNCAGLYSDHIARMSGMNPKAQIVPFRGEYYELKPEARNLCRTLIYPVPDPAFPFLGVHFTKMIGGGVECGPNAVLAFAREGYTKTKFNPAELFSTLRFRGFHRLALKHWKMGAYEMYRSWSKRAFVAALKRLIPEIEGKDLIPGGAGVRAQAIMEDGSLVDDFFFEDSKRMVHVLNAPSPAATSCLAIGGVIAERISPRIG